MSKNSHSSYLSKKGWREFIKSRKRKEKKAIQRAGWHKHQINMIKKAKLEGKIFKHRPTSHFYNSNKLGPRPQYSENIKFLSSVPDLFTKNQYNTKDTHLYIPHCFSLIENYEESFNFLKKLFVILHKEKTDRIILDYKNCVRIDVDASICMDIILAEFINYIRKCRKLGYNGAFKNGITPINYEKENIKKVLFSIGAYRNIRGVTIRYPDVLDLPVQINDNTVPEVWSKSEVDLTNIVEYIKSCLKRLNRELTADAENEFYKVIGEIMSNALEHSTMQFSYAIGFFQETRNDTEHFGVFNFSIFNFGDTIYETFKREDCLNVKAVQQMTNLSEDYTKKGWFRKAAFEEETLWTLYALQEGVTSKKKKRGNGSIQYIENFFKLKGDVLQDNISSLVLLSGNTRIVFDGAYSITENDKKGENRKYKMITFNESGDIHDEPDGKYVTFAPHYFPGTMISARILIKFDNTFEAINGN